jgi:hypothetical protein
MAKVTYFSFFFKGVLLHGQKSFNLRKQGKKTQTDLGEAGLE